MTKVSVIIPCHNTAEFLPTCLNSVCKQTLEDIEILAINDHSTDNTLEILKQFEKEYSNKLKVYSLQDKKGVSSARNLGLHYANGEYIGFVDSDDVVSLNMFKDFYQLAREQDVKIVVGSYMPIHDREYRNLESFETIWEYQKRRSNYMKDYNSFFEETPAVWDKLFAHDLIGDIKFLEGKIFEDAGFCYPLLLKAKETYEIIRGDYCYRDRKGSITSNLSEPTIKIFDMLDVIEFMNEYAQNNHFDETQKVLLRDRIKERLFMTIALIEDWKIEESKKIELINQTFRMYESLYGSFKKFETIEANDMFESLLLLRREGTISENNPKESIEAQKNEVLKLVKSLSTTRE